MANPRQAGYRQPRLVRIDLVAIDQGLEALAQLRQQLAVLRDRPASPQPARLSAPAPNASGPVRSTRSSSLSDTRRVLCYYRMSPDGTRMVFGGRARFTQVSPEVSAPLLTSSVPPDDSVMVFAVSGAAAVTDPPGLLM